MIFFLSKIMESKKKLSAIKRQKRCIFFSSLKNKTGLRAEMRRKREESFLTLTRRGERKGRREKVVGEKEKDPPHESK